MTQGAVTAVSATLSEGLHALGAILPIDGSIPWIPHGVQGYEPCLVYLLEGRNKKLLIDTGLPIHRDTVVSQLRRLVPADGALSILLTRPEPDSVGNVGAIVEEFPVEHVVGFSVNPLEFFPESMRRSRRAVRYERRRLGGSWQWDDGRTIEFLPAPLGLLATAWPYDAATGALFTSDSFGWIHLQNPEASCVADTPTPAITPAAIEAHLLCRFHWLSALRPERVERALEHVFEPRGVSVIAPSHGCAICGSARVTDEYHRIRAALEGTGRRALINR